MSPQPTAQHGPPPRILRIGIILGGNIIEERLIRKRETITVGQSSKNTFSVPLEGLPKQWPLFALENGRYVLRFGNEMDGRVSDGQGVRTLASLKGREAVQRGDHFALPLSDRSRGKIVAGDMTLLFQFVAAPPLQARPRLPASVRGTLADRVDPQLSIILAISIIAHFALALYAYQHDQTVQTRVEKLHSQYVADKYEERTVEFFDAPATGTTEEAGGEEEEAEEEEKQTPDEPKKTQEPEEQGGGDSAPDEAAIQETINNTAFVAIATGGEGEEGRYDEMGNVDQGSSLNKSLENVKNSGAQVSAVGKPGDRDTRGPKSGRVGSDKGERVSGPSGNVGTGSKKEEKIKSLAKYDVLDIGADTTLDPDAVVRRIRSRYLSGIKRCHQRVLKVDPQAGGRVNIRITIGPSGRVTRAAVKGFDATVDACIKGLTGRWRFGIPKDKSGKPGQADFAIPLILKAGR